MEEAQIDLDWWPPEPTKPVGQERAKELAARLEAIADPVIAEAAADLRSRLGPHAEIAWSGSLLEYIVRFAFGRETDALRVGTLYQTRVGDPQQNVIQLDRDGVLRWHRGREPHR